MRLRFLQKKNSRSVALKHWRAHCEQHPLPTAAELAGDPMKSEHPLWVSIRSDESLCKFDMATMVLILQGIAALLSIWSSLKSKRPSDSFSAAELTAFDRGLDGRSK